MIQHIRITETDQDYVKSIGEYLTSLGALPLMSRSLIPTDFTLDDDIDVSHLHGITPILNQSSYTKEVEWLDNYSGNFPFYISLKTQFKWKGTLSPKQWASVTKALNQSNTPKHVTVKEFTIKVGQLIRVSRFGAKLISNKSGYTAKHFIFEVTQVLNETDKAYHLTLKFSAKKTSHCSICGLFLENPESVKAGIGPICAEKMGLSFSQVSLEELSTKLTTMQSVTLWFPKTLIKSIE